MARPKPVPFPHRNSPLKRGPKGPPRCTAGLSQEQLRAHGFSYAYRVNPDETFAREDKGEEPISAPAAEETQSAKLGSGGPAEG